MWRMFFIFSIKYLLVMFFHGLILATATEIIRNSNDTIDSRAEEQGDEINLEFFKKQILTIIPFNTACWGPCGGFSSDNLDPIRLHRSNKCNGLINECQFFTGPYDMGDARYCLSTDKKSLLGARTTLHQQFGVDPTRNCQEGIKYKPKNGNCYCLCTCTANGNNEYEHNWYFSGREQESDIANNKVVTGVRFTKLNNVIYLQINEAVPKSRGVGIWRSISNFSNDDEDIIPITYYRRTLKLNEIYLPPDYLITGVRLTKADDVTLRLEVKGTRFDLNENRFVLNDQKWFNADTNLNKSPFDNISWTPELYNYAKTNLPLKFRAENFKYDFGKTTLPRLYSWNIRTKKNHGLNAIRLSRIFLFTVETIIPQISSSKIITRKLDNNHIHANETTSVDSNKK